MAFYQRSREPLPFGQRRPLFPPGSGLLGVLVVIHLSAAEMALERRLYARALVRVQRNVGLARSITATFGTGRTRLAGLTAGCARGRILVLLGGAVAL